MEAEPPSGAWLHPRLALELWALSEQQAFSTLWRLSEPQGLWGSQVFWELWTLF